VRYSEEKRQPDNPFPIIAGFNVIGDDAYCEKCGSCACVSSVMANKTIANKQKEINLAFMFLFLMIYLSMVTAPCLLITIPFLSVPSAIQLYVSIGWFTPLSFPSHPSFGLLPSYTFLPKRFTIRR
jgi:hypothetical protein